MKTTHSLVEHQINDDKQWTPLSHCSHSSTVTGKMHWLIICNHPRIYADTKWATHVQNSTVCQWWTWLTVTADRPRHHPVQSGTPWKWTKISRGQSKLKYNDTCTWLTTTSINLLTPNNSCLEYAWKEYKEPHTSHAKSKAAATNQIYNKAAIYTNAHNS